MFTCKIIYIVLFFFTVSLHAVTHVPAGGDVLQYAARAGLIKPGVPLKIHLGCGEQYFHGYINIDFPSTHHTVQQNIHADLLGDFTSFYFLPYSVHEIRSHHVFEHFMRPIALALLVAWNKALVEGGILVIETPDALGCMKQLVSDEYDYHHKQIIMRHLFGSHEADWAIHCDGWYSDKFQEILSLLGFSIKTTQYGGYRILKNITVTAQKVEHLTYEKARVLVEKILKESLVVYTETALLRTWMVMYDQALHAMTPKKIT